MKDTNEAEAIASGLTEKQRKFCEHYVLNSGNATKAVRDAGYACRNSNSCSQVGFENLRKPEICEYIAALRKQIGRSFAVTAEETIAGLREVRNRAMQEEPVFDRKGKPTGVYQSDLSAAIRAIELLGKTIGMFVDRKELSSANESALQVRIIELPSNGR